MGAETPLVAVVAGDVTMDWHLARVRRTGAVATGWSDRDRTHLSAQAGGAALVGALLDVVAARLRAGGEAVVDVRRVPGPGAEALPTDGRVHHAFALWSPFPRERGAAGEKAWRIEEFLGLDPVPADARQPEAPWSRVPEDPAGADLIVLDDAGLGFRDRPELWPRALDPGAGRLPWVLLKMARPVARSPLWERLEGMAERLIVVLGIDDLRQAEVQVSADLSWERTAQDLVWELVHNPAVNALSRAAHVVVSLDTAGALLLSSVGAVPEQARPRAALVFDPAVIGDAWRERHPGGVVGSTSCLAAAIARQILLSPKAPDVELGVRQGLAALRALHRHGYRDLDPDRPGTQLGFPFEAVAAELEGEATPFAGAEVPDPARFVADPAGDRGGSAPGWWTILQDHYPGGLGSLAPRVAVEGAEATLEGVPLGRFGRLLTVDRREIEGFRSIAALIREYSRTPRPRRPLSIAVFGPPGAGKSFGIVEVATSILPDRITVLTFNLSQLNDPAELLDALHQVRDAALSGKLPLVFWDEFDAALHGQPLGWLRHFLAPMQDGAFQEGQVVHPIGPGVFVFAGGTSERMGAFGRPVTEQFRAAKGPDFVSRLKGYVDILGPDPRGGKPAADPHHVIRRAILLRSILLRDAPHLFRTEDGREVLQIDPGVLRAFLHTRAYRHGARSMESVAAMSALSGRSRFERSCLPAEAQLDLHVDAVDFLALVQRLDLEGELLERLAESAHVVYCAGLLAAGVAWGEPTTEYLRRHRLLEPFADAPTRASPGATHPSLVSYERLAEDLREQNRGLVREIPAKLAAAGYMMRPARSDDPPFEFSKDEVEALAEQEHDRWMRARLSGGWCYGPDRSDADLVHDALMTWRALAEAEVAERYGAHAPCLGPGQLPEEQKEKDRDLVRGIPRMLAVAGYTIVRVGGEAGAEPGRSVH